MTRNEAIAKLKIYRDYLCKMSSVFDVNEVAKPFNMAIEALSADVVEVKYGKWEMIDSCEPIRYGCSNCKILSWDTYNYCPNCGARMVDGNG